ncbi:MAG: NHL repeat-containing protein, partial [Pyrinomonadaceae bacterium]
MLPRLALALLVVSVAILHLACSRAEQADRTPKFASTIAGANGEFGETFAIAVKDSDVYISDGQNGMIWKVRDGNATPFWEDLNTPSGLAVASDGSLVVADAGRNQILITHGGPDVWGNAYGYGGRGDNARGFADGDKHEALFNGPLGVAAAADGKIYVADTYNDRIRVLDIEHDSVTTLAGGSRGYADGIGAAAKFDTPCGIAVWDDKVLVADTGNHR